MRIFLAGASGAIGSRLVPLLVDAGHTVGAMTRSDEKASGLAAMARNRSSAMSSTARVSADRFAGSRPTCFCTN